MTKWSVPALTAAFILGAVVGGSFTQPQPLRAAGSMPVYGIYEANVTDQENYKDKFLSLVVPKLEKNGIKYLARGGKNQTLIGAEAPNSSPGKASAQNAVRLPLHSRIGSGGSSPLITDP